MVKKLLFLIEFFLIFKKIFVKYILLLRFNEFESLDKKNLIFVKF